MTSTKQQNKIPQGWREVKIKEIAKTSSGGTPKSTNRLFYNGMIPWLKSGEVRRGLITTFDNYITKSGLNNSSAKLFSENTVLIAMYGATAGQIGILKKKASTNQAICAIIPNKKYNSNYLYMLLSTRTEHFLMMGTGAAQPNISQNIIKNYKILLPPLPEQHRIVTVLETWDKMLELLDKKIKMKKNVKKGLMQKLLTGEMRLPGFSEEWKEVKLGEIANFVKGKELSKNIIHPNGKNECVLYGELFTKYTEYTYEVISRTNKKTPIYSTLGDILIPASDVTPFGLGTATALMKENVLLGGDINIIRPLECIDSIFLSYKLNLEKKKIIRLVTGTTIRHLYLNDIEKIKLNLPPLPEQATIASILTTSDKEIKTLEKKRDIIADQKKYLLNNLITGKIRAPEDIETVTQCNQLKSI